MCIFLGLFSFNHLNQTLFEKSVGVIISPFQSAIYKSTTWLESKFKVIKDFNTLVNKNKDLKLELADKNLEIKRLSQLELENQKLSKLLNTASKYNEYESVAAHVIAKDPSNFYENFVIDKGSKDGIEKNMVVIASGGLVGKIEGVGYNYSKVSSIINGTYSVSSKALRTDDEGFVKGNILSKGTCKMQYIDKDAEIKKGDEIVTSHLSEIYPAGITIGYVTDIFLDDKNKLSKTAIINPTVDFKHLDRVLIISKHNNIKSNEKIYKNNIQNSNSKNANQTKEETTEETTKK